MSFSENAWSVFNRCIGDYHILDNVDAQFSNPYNDNSLEHYLYQKCWIDTVQWHLEDMIRDQEISAENALLIKRRIDKSNQERTDIVEQIDNWFWQKFQTIQPTSDARINTESPAWAIDRFSILALKIFHMQIEANRANASEDHRKNCSEKLQILLLQQNDLSTAIDELLLDIENGLVKLRMYKQMKMYNDESLNPILYQNQKNG